MRKKLFKWHSVSALFALIPLIVISVTGSILVFKTEIDTWLMPSHMSVDVTPFTQRASLNALVKKVEDTFPDYIVGSWELFDDKSRTDAAYILTKSTGEWHKVYIDQYNIKVLSQPVTLTNDITDWLVSLHYTFLLGVTGAVFGLIFAIILLFLGISGIILHRQFWKKLFVLRFSAARRILFSDVHKMIGIISSPIILILAFTGGYWNGAVVLHETVEHAGEHPAPLKHAIYKPELNFDTLLKENQTHLPGFKATYFVLPYEQELDITFYGALPDINMLSSQYSSTITYNKETGEKLAIYDIRQANPIFVFIDMFRRLHFGNFAGLPSKIMWCVLGLSPLWLALTGLYFYLFRIKKRKKAQQPTSEKEQLALNT